MGPEGIIRVFFIPMMEEGTRTVWMPYAVRALYQCVKHLTQLVSWYNF